MTLPTDSDLRAHRNLRDRHEPALPCDFCGTDNGPARPAKAKNWRHLCRRCDARFVAGEIIEIANNLKAHFRHVGPDTTDVSGARLRLWEIEERLEMLRGYLEQKEQDDE